MGRFSLPIVSLLSLRLLHGNHMESCCHISIKVSIIWNIGLFNHLNIIFLICPCYFYKSYRSIGVFYPRELKRTRFRRLSMGIVALAWLISLIPLLPASAGTFGKFGLECKTRKCTPINMNEDGSPTSINGKSVGRSIVYVAGVFLFVFNAIIYYKLWVNGIIFKNWKIMTMNKF